MRVLQEGCFTTPICDVRDSASASLDNAQTKPKRRPQRYRVVERPDGMIVERPRYRPTASLQSEVPRTNHILADPKIPTTQAEGVKSSRMTYELLGIGISETDSGSRNHGESTEDTRRGHGLIQYQHIHIEIEKYTVERENYISLDRFLYDRGPWSSYSQRKSG